MQNTKHDSAVAIGNLVKPGAVPLLCSEVFSACEVQSRYKRACQQTWD